MAAEAKKADELKAEEGKDDPTQIVDPPPARKFTKRIVGKE